MSIRMLAVWIALVAYDEYDDDEDCGKDDEGSKGNRQ